MLSSELYLYPVQSRNKIKKKKNIWELLISGQVQQTLSQVY